MVANTTFKSKKEEIKIDGLKWINIPDAGEEDIKYLERNFKFHHLDLEDCLTENQRSKIDEYPDYLFIILHLPFLHRRSKRITPLELDIFVKDGLLITIHENHPIVNKIFENCKKNPTVKKDYFNNSSGYLMYRILNEVFENVFPMVDDISKNLNHIEQDVFEDHTGKDRLKDILLMKKDLINFRRIIMPQRSVIAQLEHLQMRFSQNELDVYFDNIVDKIEKIFGVLENLKDLVDSLHQTNESIISHNTNNIIRVLTIFSVIMMPLTVITGFYGMNLKGLPFDNHNFAVGIVGGIMIGVLTGMLAYFRYKKWI
jgi:magnesium transporter